MSLPKKYDIPLGEWPKHYPEVLKEVSWCLYDEAGPYTNYNIHMKSKNKLHPLLLMGVVKNIFKTNGIEFKYGSDYYELCLHFTRCFKVMFNEKQLCFKMKQKYKNNEPVFKYEDWKTRCEKIGLKTKEENIELLKMLCKKSIEFYNMLIEK